MVWITSQVCRNYVGVAYLKVTVVLGVERHRGGVTVEGGEMGGGAISESRDMPMCAGGLRLSLKQRGEERGEGLLLVTIPFSLCNNIAYCTPISHLVSRAITPLSVILLCKTFTFTLQTNSNSTIRWCKVWGKSRLSCPKSLKHTKLINAQCIVHHCISHNIGKSQTIVYQMHRASKFYKRCD